MYYVKSSIVNLKNGETHILTPVIVKLFECYVFKLDQAF